MKRNKILKVMALSALGLLALTACDDVVAKPQDYSEKLITIEGYNKDIYNNNLSVVYDDIHDSGNLGSDVLNEILYRYAISMFGSYNMHVTPTPADGETTLEAAVNDIKADGTAGEKANAFILGHKAYWTVNSDGKRINDNDEVVANDAPASKSECARLKAKWETIDSRIKEVLFNKISSGDYSERNIFSEKKFLRSLFTSLNDVANVDDAGFTGKLYEGLIIPDYEKDDVFGNAAKGLAPILNRENYQTAGKYSYFEKELIPDIYRQLLNEQYLLDETYNTIGRSFARKVNIIKIADNTNYAKASDYLMKELVNDINAQPKDASGNPVTKIEDSANKVTLDTFKTYSDVYIGNIDNDVDPQTGKHTKEYDLVNRTSLKEIFPAATYGTVDYYEHTSFGDLISDYKKITPNSATTDTTQEDTFTSSHTYTKETGLALKTRELKLKDFTTTGWYVKNGGLTDLPDSIRNRLFNIGVATGISEYDELPTGTKGAVYTKNQLDRWQYKQDTGWTYGIPKDGDDIIESSYVARINGKNYLKKASRVQGESEENDILHYDSSSKTYYVIQIEEAVSSSKLSKESVTSYKKTRSAADMETIVNEITRIIGVSESYATLAKEHYLEKMNIKYHDQTVYDYFNTNYPDLFD